MLATKKAFKLDLSKLLARSVQVDVYTSQTDYRSGTARLDVNAQNATSKILKHGGLRKLTT